MQSQDSIGRLRYLSVPIISFLCRQRYLRHPLIIAALMWLSFRKCGLNRHAARYSVLVLPRAGLMEDAIETFGKDANFEMLVAPPALMKAVAGGFLPPTVDDNNYVNLTEVEEQAKRDYRAFLSRVVVALRRMIRIDAIVSGNFAYASERELHAAADSNGLPFIVLHKENLKSPGRLAYFEGLYRNRRGPFTGRHIVVYNAFEREAQVAAGVAEPNQITVCGMPRLDRLHAWRKAAAGSALGSPPTIVYFTFAAKTGLPVLRRKFCDGFTEPLPPQLQQLSWTDTEQQTSKADLRFALDNPSIRVIVKSKHGSRHQASFFKARAASLPDNIELVEGGDPTGILHGAWAVIGMNSTTVLEALAMGKTVLTPGYAEAGHEAMQHWIADFGPGVERMYSPEELFNRLAEVCSGPPPVIPRRLSRAVIAALTQWAGNADGHASERVRSVLEAEIDSGAPK